MRIVIGYQGEGRHRTPVFADEGPARGRVAGVRSIGPADHAIGGELVQGESEADASRRYTRTWRAKRTGG